MLKADSKVRRIMVKATFFGVIIGAMAMASYAQSGRLFYARSNSMFGTIQAFPNLWRILPNGGGEIKIYSCKGIGGGGLSCVFTQFNNSGRVSYSGFAQVFTSGAVNMQYRWDFTSGFQRDMNYPISLQVR